MEEVGVQTAALFDQSQPESAMALVQAAIARTEAMAAEFGSITGDNNTHEHVTQMFTRLARIVHGLGEVASEVAGLDEGVQQLFAGWGIGISAPAPLNVSQPSPAVEKSSTPAVPMHSTLTARHVLSVFAHTHGNLQPERVKTYPQWSEYTGETARQSNMVAITRQISDVLKGAERGGPRILGALYAAASLHSRASPADATLLTKINRKGELPATVCKDLVASIDTLSLHEGKSVYSTAPELAGVPPSEVPEHLRDPAMPEAPLHVLVNAADVVSGSPQSVMPDERPQFSIETQLDGQRKYVSQTADETKRFRSVHEEGVYGQRVKDADRVAKSLHGHLECHYDVTIDNADTLSFLAEARVAERVGIVTAPHDLRVSVQARLDVAWNRLPPAEAARLTHIYTRVTGI
jgi:hypothetical protein